MLPADLLARLALDADAFDTLAAEWFAAMEGRPFGPEQLAHALAYPWERPVRSYRLRDGEVELVDDPEPPPGRHPILAFGSNGAPSTLQRKFAHFEDPRDREITVHAGELHDFDVGPAASIAVYGALPATLFPSPGTRVRAAVLHCTDAQATQLTWSELSYHVGHLEVVFEGTPATVLAYASRFGTLCPDGEPVALAAIPATGRTAPALTQQELLDVAARLTLGPDATARDIVALVFADPARAFALVREHLRPRARPFSASGWTAVRA